jgi:plasmid stability protein
MASITIRKLPEITKRRLRVRAARNGRSMEQEARAILDRSLQQPEDSAENLAVAIHKRFAALGGVELNIPKREPIPEDRIRRLFR